MKKYLKFLILPILLLALVIPSRAASAGSMQLSAPVQVIRGQTVTITVAIENADPVLAVMIQPVYDTSAFEFVEGKFLHKGDLVDFNSADGVIAWENPVNPTGSFARFTLKVKENAKLTSYSIGCKYSVRDSSDVLHQGENAFVNVTVGSVLPGDFTGDNVVDNKDVEYLLWHTLFPQEFSLNQSGNVDSTGTVDNKDVEYLLWHTLYPEDFPLYP